MVLMTPGLPVLGYNCEAAVQPCILLYWCYFITVELCDGRLSRQWPGPLEVFLF